MCPIPRYDDRGRFHVLEVKPRSESIRMEEQLGSKDKFWALIGDETQPWLFKYARDSTGEHWSEKLGAELAGLVGVPSARVELAEADGSPGCLVESIVPHRWDPIRHEQIPQGELTHGNEVLAGYLECYDKDSQRVQSAHMYGNIESAIGKAVPPDQYLPVMRAFAGLIVLDAVIGNTDRHHENWALLRESMPHGSIGLAPSYDHASSLGRELTDERRLQILQTKALPAYVHRAHGAIFGEATAGHPESPLELVRWGLNKHSDVFRPWVARAGRVVSQDVEDLLAKMPDTVMSWSAKEFCNAFVCYTLSELKGF